jgi:hypothetical protein
MVGNATPIIDVSKIIRNCANDEYIMLSMD